jgi:hypothetical protein
MDTVTCPSIQTASAAAEPAKRFLDPFAEWTDCANQWDVSEVWRARREAASADATERREKTHPSQ